MKRLMNCLLLAAGVGLAACTGPIAANQDPNTPMQVTVQSYWLQNEIYVTALPSGRVGAGQLKAPIEIRNKTDHDLSLDYTYSFVDKNGVQVDNPPSWEHVSVPSRNTVQLAPTSMSAAAADFRVQIREAK